jgi:hypothetical protein
MDGMFRGYTLIETDEFIQQMEQIEQIAHVDEALEGLKWALSNNPEAFPILPNTRKLRIAKTIVYVREGLVVPPLRVFFSIEDDYVVLLRWIEPRPGFGLDD